MVFAKLLQITDALRHRKRRSRMTADHALGQRGEDLAHRFLQKSGFAVVARNYRMSSGRGELDLVAWDGEMLVFVEVKSRRTDEFGSPDRAISAHKLRSMTRAAREYARHSGTAWDAVRFDVVNVVFSEPLKITHLRNVLPDRRERSYN